MTIGSIGFVLTHHQMGPFGNQFIWDTHIRGLGTADLDVVTERPRLMFDMSEDPASIMKQKSRLGVKFTVCLTQMRAIEMYLRTNWDM